MIPDDLAHGPDFEAAASAPIRRLERGDRLRIHGLNGGMREFVVAGVIEHEDGSVTVVPETA